MQALPSLNRLTDTSTQTKTNELLAGVRIDGVMLISLGRDIIVSPLVSTHSKGVIINRITPDLQSALRHYRGFMAASYFHYI